jgi:hypothetical protein
MEIKIEKNGDKQHIYYNSSNNFWKFAFGFLFIVAIGVFVFSFLNGKADVDYGGVQTANESINN